MVQEEGYKLGRKALKQVAQAVRDNERRIRSSPDASGGRYADQRDLCVILDAALAAATDSKTGGSSCDAAICTWSNEDQEYTESGRTITVWNHSESTDHAIDTFGYARWVDGHWVFFGDCDAMGAR